MYGVVCVYTVLQYVCAIKGTKTLDCYHFLMRHTLFTVCYLEDL